MMTTIRNLTLHSSHRVLTEWNRPWSMKVLVNGRAFIGIYTYCSPLGWLISSNRLLNINVGNRAVGLVEVLPQASSKPQTVWRST